MGKTVKRKKNQKLFDCFRYQGMIERVTFLLCFEKAAHDLKVD